MNKFFELFLGDKIHQISASKSLKTFQVRKKGLNAKSTYPHPTTQNPKTSHVYYLDTFYVI